MNIRKKIHKRRQKRYLLGIGMDNQDGHKRLTEAEDFSVIGGSEETHEMMSETLIKTFEYLARKDKTLDEISRAELSELFSRESPE